MVVIEAGAKVVVQQGSRLAKHGCDHQRPAWDEAMQPGCGHGGEAPTGISLAFHIEEQGKGSRWRRL